MKPCNNKDYQKTEIISKIPSRLPWWIWGSWWNKEAQTVKEWPVVHTKEIPVDIKHTIAAREAYQKGGYMIISQ